MTAGNNRMSEITNIIGLIGIIMLTHMVVMMMATYLFAEEFVPFATINVEQKLKKKKNLLVVNREATHILQRNMDLLNI